MTLLDITTTKPDISDLCKKSGDGFDSNSYDDIRIQASRHPDASAVRENGTRKFEWHLEDGKSIIMILPDGKVLFSRIRTEDPFFHSSYRASEISALIESSLALA